MSRGQVSPGEWPLSKNRVIARGFSRGSTTSRRRNGERSIAWEKRVWKERKSKKHILYFTSGRGCRRCSTSSLLGKSVFLGFILFSDAPRTDPTNVRCVRMRCIIMQHERVCQCGYTGTIHLPIYLPIPSYLTIYLSICQPPHSRDREFRVRISGKRFALPELINSEAPNEISKAKDAVRK